MSPRCGQGQGAFLLAWSVLHALEMFPEDLHRLGALGFFMLFEGVLRRALVHPQYLSLYQQTLKLLMPFEAFLRQDLVHRLSHLSLYQQTQGFFVLFLIALLHVLVHPQCLGTLLFLVLSEIFLLHVLVHHPCLYQQTHLFLVLFWEFYCRSIYHCFFIL